MSRLVRNRTLRRYIQRVSLLRDVSRAIEDAALVAFWAVCGWLPPGRASCLGAAIVGALGPFTDKHEKIDLNLRIAFPDLPASERRRIARGVWRNMGACAGEYPHLAGFTPGSAGGLVIESRVLPEIEANFEGRRLTVFATGHIGNWEVLALAPRIWGLDLAVVYTPISDGFADRRLYAYREGMGSRLLPRDGSARALLRHLKSGRPIGIVADHRNEEGELLPFFAHTKMTTLSPARLALKTGADFVPIRVVRLAPAHFRIEGAPPIRPPLGDLSEEAKAAAMMAGFNRQLEAWISEYPDQWMCGKRTFPKAVGRALKEAEALPVVAEELPDAR